MKFQNLFFPKQKWKVLKTLKKNTISMFGLKLRSKEMKNNIFEILVAEIHGWYGEVVED